MTTIGIPKEIHPGEKRVAATPQTIIRLRKLGFEVLTEMQSSNALVGRIAIEKIAEIAEIDGVTFISPQNR